MAGLSLSVALVVVVVLLRGLGSESLVVTPPGQGQAAPPSIQPGAASVTLSRLQDAIASGDRDAAAALGADDAGATLAQTLVDNVRTASITEVDLRYVDETGSAAADGGWGAAVATTWRYDGFDTHDNRAEVEFGFVATGTDEVGLTALGDGLRVPIWMSGTAQVRRTPDTLVLAVGDDPRLAAYSRMAQRAVPVVDSVVTTWRPPRLVVEVPAGLTGLEQAVGATPGDYAAIAAVTTSSDGRAGPRVPVHVLVNPDVLGRLRGAAAQVVVSHESTHVATDGPSSRAPTWLVEGIADYVALRRIDLPLSTTAAQIGAEVRKDGLPDALPDAADFDPLGLQLGAAYESAWLVCVTLGERRGPAEVLELYDRLSDGSDLAPALRELFDWTPAQLVTAWRGRLAGIPS